MARWVQDSRGIHCPGSRQEVRRGIPSIPEKYVAKAKRNRARHGARSYLDLKKTTSWLDSSAPRWLCATDRPARPWVWFLSPQRRVPDLHPRRSPRPCHPPPAHWESQRLPEKTSRSANNISPPTESALRHPADR